MIYLIILVLLLAVELLYFRIADKLNIIDKPNQRSSHKQITLRGGGVVFYLAALGYFFYTGMPYPFFFIGLTLIAGISFADDVHSVPNKIRLIIHFISMLLMFYQLGLFTDFPLWYLLIALIFCTGVINAYNFMDGINGITGGYSLVVLGILYWLNRSLDFIDIEFLRWILLADVVFCFFNFRKKAKCFAGDVGSVSMAFIVVFVLGKLILKTGDVTYIVLLAVYGVDTVLTIIHRLILKENITQPHRKHAYQIMANELKMPHVGVSLLYMFLQLLAWGVYKYSGLESVLSLVIILVVYSSCYIFFMRKYFPLHLAYLRDSLKN